jgi:AraC-like DNA-binding protein
LSPLRYFRYRLLNRARERLIAADEGHETISDIAMDLGFTHLGRFASRYEQLFGELPSATLCSQQ